MVEAKASAKDIQPVQAKDTQEAENLAKMMVYLRAAETVELKVFGKVEKLVS